MSLFCSHCGHRHVDPQWPKLCSECGETTWKNPLPVAIVLQPIGDNGLLVIRRGIEPQRGHLALPGGYVDWRETWQQGAARELKEETGLSTDPEGIRLFDTVSPPDGRTVIIVGLAPSREADGLPPFPVTEETMERRVLTAPQVLAFPIHTNAMARFFAGHRGPVSP